MAEIRVERVCRSCEAGSEWSEDARGVVNARVLGNLGGARCYSWHRN